MKIPFTGAYHVAAMRSTLGESIDQAQQAKMTPRDAALRKYNDAAAKLHIGCDVPDRMRPASVRWKNFDPSYKANVLHTCRLPDGKLVTRSSRHAYTHAVAVWDETPNGGGPAHWGCLSWHSSESLAQKTARHWSRVYPRFEIVSVTRATA